MGANGGDEVLSHPFFSNIDLDQLFEKKLVAPFLPKAIDPEQMRQQTTKVVRLRDLRESMPSEETENLIKDVNLDLFG